METEDRIGLRAAFQERHPRIYTLLFQLVLAIATFYCAIAIGRYGPELDPATVSPVSTQSVPNDANATTPHICPNGAREDLMDLGPILTAITPYSVLCPSTPFFLLCILSFFSGIFKFNSLHTPDPKLATFYGYLVIVGLISLDWRDWLVSFQTMMPLTIWTTTVLIPPIKWLCKMLFKMLFPRSYAAYMEAMRKQKEERRLRSLLKSKERVGDAEGGEDLERGTVEESVDEETPLMTDGGKTGLDT